MQDVLTKYQLISFEILKPYNILIML